LPCFVVPCIANFAKVRLATLCAQQRKLVQAKFAIARFRLTGEYFDRLYFAKISFETVKYRRNFAENRFREMSAENKEQNSAKFVGITFASYLVRAMHC